MKKNITYLAVVICVIVLIVLFKNQLKGNLVYLMLLACPLMHLVMMKGMHGNHKSDASKEGKEEPNKSESCH